MYLIDTNKVSCFFAGDTALTSDTTHLVEKHLLAHGRSLDLALLPIGHAPWWKPGFRKGHLTSSDALTLFERLQAKYFIPYHWGTFNHVTSTALDRKSTRLNSSHVAISYAVFCLKKKRIVRVYFACTSRNN